MIKAMKIKKINVAYIKYINGENRLSKYITKNGVSI